jgi:hypothetical protein
MSVHSRISPTGFSSPIVTRTPSSAASVVMSFGQLLLLLECRRSWRVESRSQNSGWSSMLMAPLT